MDTKRFKEIFRNNTAFGGRVYRVMSNGTQARIESSDEGRSWIARKTMPLDDFELWAETIELRNPYRSNPAHLDLLVHAQ